MPRPPRPKPEASNRPPLRPGRHPDDPAIPTTEWGRTFYASWWALQRIQLSLAKRNAECRRVLQAGGDDDEKLSDSAYEVRRDCEGLAYVHAYALLEAVLRRFRDEGKFTVLDVYPPLSKLLKASATTLKWQKYETILNGFVRRNDLARDRDWASVFMATEVIKAIQDQLIDWGVAPDPPWLDRGAAAGAGHRAPRATEEAVNTSRHKDDQRPASRWAVAQVTVEDLNRLNAGLQWAIVQIVGQERQPFAWTVSREAAVEVRDALEAKDRGDSD